MTIEIDEPKFREILAALGEPRIPPVELVTIEHVLELAAAIDLRDDQDERALADTLIARLRSIGAPAPAPIARVPTDPEERATAVAQLAGSLAQPAARELAYALAYLVIAADLELAPVESAFLEDLRRAFAIPPERASVLAETAAEIATPGA